MLSSGNGSEMSNQMTFGHAAPGEALTSSALSAVLPGIEENVELSGYVRQLENVSDQRILAIVQGSEENIALQKQIVEITERAQQLAASESQ